MNLNDKTLIQYASDLHLEHEPDQNMEDFQNIIAPRKGSEILILAGDISNPRLEIFIRFMKWCVKNWNTVIIIPGNHEYYYDSIENTNQYLFNLSKQNGFIFLANRNYILKRKNSDKDLLILGSTLWSEIPEEHSTEVRNHLNDFKLIKEFNQNWKYYNILHRNAKLWLEDCLDGVDNYEVVVVSHHAPVEEITSSHIYHGKITNKGFASNCHKIMKNVNVWIFGHTHFNPYPILENGCIVLSNQRGYRGNCKNYRKQACFSI